MARSDWTITQEEECKTYLQRYNSEAEPTLPRAYYSGLIDESLGSQISPESGDNALVLSINTGIALDFGTLEGEEIISSAKSYSLNREIPKPGFEVEFYIQSSNLDTLAPNNNKGIAILIPIFGKKSNLIIGQSFGQDPVLKFLFGIGNDSGGKNATAAIVGLVGEGSNTPGFQEETETVSNLNDLFKFSCYFLNDDPEMKFYYGMRIINETTSSTVIEFDQEILYSDLYIDFPFYQTGFEVLFTGDVHTGTNESHEGYGLELDAAIDDFKVDLITEPLDYSGT